MNQILKAGCIGLYVLAIAAFFVELPFGVGPWAQRLALLFMVAHALELLVAFKHVKAYQGPLWKSVALTMLFGLFHWWPIAKAQAKGQANEPAGA